jgi:hypothetical protein
MTVFVAVGRIVGVAVDVGTGASVAVGAAGWQALKANRANIQRIPRKKIVCSFIQTLQSEDFNKR